MTLLKSGTTRRAWGKRSARSARFSYLDCEILKRSQKTSLKCAATTATINRRHSCCQALSNAERCRIVPLLSSRSVAKAPPEGALANNIPSLLTLVAHGVQTPHLMARILVIDDEREMRGILEAVLKSVGHEVILAASGSEGLRRYRDMPADLVITDIFMPDMDGIETIQALRREFPEAKFLAMSGRAAAESTLAVAKKLGALGILEKPFPAEHLLAAVQQAL